MKLFFAAVIFFGSAFLSSQSANGQDIFDATILHEIRISFTERNWYDTLTQYYTDALDGSSKKFLPVTIKIDGHALAQNSGIRFKGEYSYTGFAGKKKPFRIHFNKFSSGQSYQNIKKINLHNLAGDPSFLREYISYDLLRTIGIPASKTSYAKLYINDEYWGCYLAVEEPEDKQFLKNNFGNSSGNLFDADGTTRLNWKGNDPDSYPELKLQTDANDSSWKNILSWMDLFNNDWSYNFQQKLYRVFNAEQFLKVLATDVFLNNWDSYSANGRNFFIYDDVVATKQLQWVPWDYNLAMWNNDLPLFPKDINSSYQYKPLIWRINGNEVLKQQYYNSFCKLLNGQFLLYPVAAKVQAAADLIRDAVTTDTNKFYSTENFENNLHDEVRVQMLRDNVMKEVRLPGITSIFSRRRESLKKELSVAGCDCDKGIAPAIPLLVTVFPNPSHGYFSIYIDEHNTSYADVGIRVFSIKGELVLKTSSRNVNGRSDVDVHNLPPGAYIVSINYGGKTKMEQIVKL